MPRKTFQPEELFKSKPWGFSQAVMGPTNGSVVTIAGQVAWDANEQIQGDTKWEQMKTAIKNVGHAIRSAGGTMDDVMHLQIHIVDFDPGEAEILAQVLIDAFGTESPPSSTWLGITSLARPEYLVEVQALAVLPA